MCIAFSVIECVYWYLRVILSSMFVGEGSYVSFLRSFFFFVFTLSCILMFGGHFIGMFVDRSSYVSFPRPSILCILFSYFFSVRWVIFSLELWVIVHSVITFTIDVTSLHVGFERIITTLRVICFTIILVFAFDSSFSFHPLFVPYSHPF